MWLLPLLVIGVVAIAAASRSAREAPPPMLLAPPHHAVSPVPGPIFVLSEFARVGQAPPPFVILCAIAEAESIGRNDLASDIMRAFVAPVVYQYARASASAIPAPAIPAPSGRGTYAPAAYERGSCALPAAPRDQATARDLAAPAQPALAARRFATDAEIRAMLDADPRRFFEMATAARGAPVIEVPAEVMHQAAVPVATSQVPSPAAEAGALTEQLIRQPGHVGAGIVQDPSTGAEVFEVRWLRDHPVPPLPQAIGGVAVRLVIVDALPVAHVETLPASFAETLPIAAAEALAQVTEAQAAPGSPIDGVSDDAWRQFVRCLERESPQFSSARHVGQYRQCRDRLAELGIDPSTIHGSSQAQRSALDVDLADAQQRLAETGDLQRHCGRRIAVPGVEEAQIATLSGILGVVQCAGLDNAIGWLERQGDRKRFPHTTQVFLRTNGTF